MHVLEGDTAMKLSLKSLWIIGFMSLIVGTGEAKPYQGGIQDSGGATVERINHHSEWCRRHPHHHTCHHHWHPPVWYDEEYREKAEYCHHHPFRESCRQFCHHHPRICFR